VPLRAVEAATFQHLSINFVQLIIIVCVCIIVAIPVYVLNFACCDQGSTKNQHKPSGLPV